MGRENWQAGVSVFLGLCFHKPACKLVMFRESPVLLGMSADLVIVLLL